MMGRKICFNGEIYGYLSLNYPCYHFIPGAKHKSEYLSVKFAGSIYVQADGWGMVCIIKSLF